MGRVVVSVISAYMCNRMIKLLPVSSNGIANANLTGPVTLSFWCSELMNEDRNSGEKERAVGLVIVRALQLPYGTHPSAGSSTRSHSLANLYERESYSYQVNYLFRFAEFVRYAVAQNSPTRASTFSFGRFAKIAAVRSLFRLPGHDHCPMYKNA